MLSYIINIITVKNLTLVKNSLRVEGQLISLCTPQDFAFLFCHNYEIKF